MSSPNLNDILAYLASHRAIECGEQLGLGNVVSTVFRARRGDRRLVVKIGLSERAATEVRMNRDGYLEMSRIGAERLIPGDLLYEEINGVPLLVMADCSPDFWHATRESDRPVDLYRQLIAGMGKVYEETRVRSEKTFDLTPLRDRLARQYTEHLSSLVPHHLVRQLLEDDLASRNFPVVCFSSFDFTPEDVFVGESGVKKADPLPPLLGIPVIDLACFAGVARDAHHLPGSGEGYDLLERYATEDLPRLLGLDRRTGIRLFSFGRALQSALSARFRLQSDPPAARQAAETSRQFLRQYLEER